ncbi:hypothetical protein Tco_1008765, partial [Tanacetum coccineum]
PEPNQVADIHDPNKMVDIPDDIDLVDYDGDKTPPPGDVSSDSESEDEEVDVAPDATIGTVTQRPFVVRDFPRGILKIGESSSAHDSSYVGGLAPWALRRDLETSRARARLTEAELSTNQTEIAILKSKNKIGEKERELLNHDLENVERALGNRDTAKRRLHESRVWNKRFYLDMVRIEAVPKPPSDDEDTERPRKKSKNSTSDGTGGARAGGARTGGARAGGAGAGGAGASGAGVGGAGPTAPEITGYTYITFMKCDPQPFKGTKGAMGLCQWFEKLESVFRISDCKERDKVKFAT